MKVAVGALRGPSLAQMLEQHGIHGNSGSYTALSVSTAEVLYLYDDSTGADESAALYNKAMLSFQAALTAAVGSITSVTIHSKSGKDLTGLGSSMQSLTSLKILQLVTTAGTLDPVRLGLILNQLQHLQDLHLEFKPGASVLDPSWGSLLAAGVGCFQRLASLHLRAGEDLMQSMWSWLRQLKQLCSLEVSPGSKVTAEQLQGLENLTALTHFVVLGSPSSSSSSSKPFVAAAALPTLPHVVSGGGEVPVGDLVHLVRALPNAKKLFLDLHFKGPGARPTGNDHSNGGGGGSSTISCPLDSEIQQALSAMRQPGQVESLALHTFHSNLGGSGGSSTPMSTPVAVVADCLPSLQHLECVPSAEDEEDGQHLAPGLLLKLTSLVCASPGLASTAITTTTSSSSSSGGGIVITGRMLEACPGLVQLEGRGVISFKGMSGLAAGMLTALTSLDLEGAAASAGSCNTGLVPVELLRLRLVKLALARLLLPQDADNPLAQILPSTLQAVQMILDSMPDYGALLHQVFQLLLLDGTHTSRQLTLAPQLPCSPFCDSPPVEDTHAAFGGQQAVCLNFNSPALLQDMAAVVLGHLAGAAQGQLLTGGAAGPSGRQQAPSVSDATEPLRSAYGNREELLRALGGVIIKLQGAGEGVAGSQQPLHQQEEGRGGQLDVERSEVQMLASSSQGSGNLQLAAPMGDAAAGASNRQKKRAISPRAGAKERPCQRRSLGQDVSGLPVDSAAGLLGASGDHPISSSLKGSSIPPLSGALASSGSEHSCDGVVLAARAPPATASTSQVPATHPGGTDSDSLEAELDAMYDDAEAAGAYGGFASHGTGRAVGGAGAGIRLPSSSSSWRTHDKYAASAGEAAAAAAAAALGGKGLAGGQLGSRMGWNPVQSLVPAAPVGPPRERFAAPCAAGAGAGSDGRQGSIAAGRLLAPRAPAMPLAEALAAIEAAKGRHSAVADPRIQRFNMEHRGMPCAQAEYAAKLKEEDEAADGMTDWLDSVAKDAVMQNKEWQAQQAAAAAAVVAEAPVAAAVVAARGAAGLAAQVPGALLAAGQLGNPVPVGPAELEQAEEQQQQQQQQQEAAAALIPEAEPMEVEAAGVVAPAVLRCHKGKEVKLYDLQAFGHDPRQVLLGLIGDASEQLLYWYGSPRLLQRKPDLHKYKYVGWQLLEALVGLLKQEVVSLSKQSWEDLSAQQVLEALGVVLQKLVRLWTRQKEYMALFSSSTGTSHVTWTLGVAARMVRKGRAADAIGDLVKATQQKKPNKDTIIEASRGAGPWALQSLGQLVRRAPHAKDMQQKVVHVNHIITDTACKEKLVEGAGLVGAVFLVHVDRLYVCIGPSNKAREEAAARRAGMVEDAGEVLLGAAYKQVVGERSSELETALQGLYDRHKPHSLPIFSMENVEREVRQESSNRLGSAFEGHGLGE